MKSIITATVITAMLVAWFAPVVHAGQQPVYVQPYIPEPYVQTFPIQPIPVYPVQRPNAWQQLGQDLQNLALRLEYQNQIRRQTEALEAIARAQQQAADDAAWAEFRRQMAGPAWVPLQRRSSTASTASDADFWAKWQAAEVKSKAYRNVLAAGAKMSWEEFSAQWGAQGGQTSSDEALEAEHEKPKACPFWRKSCWK